MRHNKQPDYFAEMYVAGLLADAGWDIYFPRRDKGFDMIVSRPNLASTIVRPVQVKGKYATEGKTGKDRYGFVGELTALHPDMILAIPYFSFVTSPAPDLVAWMPYDRIKPGSRGHSCEPAVFREQRAQPRRDYAIYFGAAGLDRFA